MVSYKHAILVEHALQGVISLLGGLPLDVLVREYIANNVPSSTPNERLAAIVALQRILRSTIIDEITLAL